MAKSLEIIFTEAGIPKELVESLLDTFMIAKTKFFIGDYRPTAIEGGRFSEIVFRVLQWWTSNPHNYTPISTPLVPVPKLMKLLENSTNHNDSVRLHIPRALRLIYDIRNRRNIAHVGKEIQPNLSDSTLVVGTMKWVLAELIRLIHKTSIEEAQGIIDSLVVKDIPIIQVFDDFPKVMIDLPAGKHLLLLLYRQGDKGATREILEEWARPSMKANLGKTLTRLNSNNYIHSARDTHYITRLGELAVEQLVRKRGLSVSQLAPT